MLAAMRCEDRPACRHACPPWCVGYIKHSVHMKDKYNSRDTGTSVSAKVVRSLDGIDVRRYA